MAIDLILKQEFTNAMKTLLASEYDDFIRALQERPPVSIRLNPRKNIDDVNTGVPWCSTGRYLDERPSFTLDPLFHAGTYYVQEASSMLVEQAISQSADLQKALTVLDLCAAPGGKSTHLLSLISNDSLLVTNEVIRSRASILAENITKWGYPNVVVTNNDPEDFQKLPSFFDVIVVDAPCSGEGLFRKEPEAMQEWSTENVALCWKRQRRILSDIWPTLKPGGTLIYCTCTYNTLENEENLRWAGNQYNATFLPLAMDPSWGVREVNDHGIVGYHCYPHCVKGEGFFMSVIRKSDEDAAEHSINKPRKNTLQIASKKIQEQIGPWIKNPHQHLLLHWRDNILLVPGSRLSEMENIAQTLHIITAGTAVAEIKHEKFIPEHALAMSIDLNKDNFPEIELTKDQALQFLRREAITVQGEKGFTLMTYQGVPLGWGNVLHNRVNNLYPSNWRIRMSGS